MSSAAPTGMASFTGQYWMPHSVKERSPTRDGVAGEAPTGDEHGAGEHEEEDGGDDVANGAAARESWL